MSHVCGSSVIILWILLGGQLCELNAWCSMGKLLECNALPSVALPVKEPQMKDWCHFIDKEFAFSCRLLRN